MKTAGFSRFSVLVSFAVLFCCSSPAQTKTQEATLSGTIVDASGGAIAKAIVTATAEGQNGAPAVTSRSRADGGYLLAIPAGLYRVRFTRAPFAPAENVVELRPGELRTLNASLALERLSSQVVVTAQAEPSLVEQSIAPVSIISKEEIDARQSVGVADALMFSPGIAIGRSGPEGGTASVFLNGGNSNFTKVLVDGAPINPPGGAVDFSSLTLDNIDKIEIVRGAESAIYGTDAVSGVIQLFTHRGETRTPEFSVFAEGGDYSSARGGGQVSGTIGAFDYSAATSYFATEGQGANDGFIDRVLSGNFGYRISDTNQIRMTLRNSTSTAGIPGQTLLEPPSVYNRSDQHIFSASARWNYSPGKHWRHEISGGESYTRQVNDNPQQSFYATDPNAFCPQTNPTAVATAEFCDFVGLSRFEYNRANVNAQSSYLFSNFGDRGINMRWRMRFYRAWMWGTRGGTTKGATWIFATGQCTECR